VHLLPYSSIIRHIDLPVHPKRTQSEQQLLLYAQLLKNAATNEDILKFLGALSDNSEYVRDHIQTNFKVGSTGAVCISAQPLSCGS
jgi:hypothetical protein